MGMFDYVNFQMPCPKCGVTLSDFQSKDRYCAMDMLEPDDVDNFYCSCHNCRQWVEFSRESISTTPKRAEPISLEQVLALGFRQEPPPND